VERTEVLTALDPQRRVENARSILTMGRLRRAIFGISPDETTFARRGFRGNNASTRQRLEQVGRVFVMGYHTALDGAQSGELALQLNGVDLEFRGFAFEGAAMGLTLLDQLSLRRRDRLQTFLEGSGAPHAYMIHVGAGWAFARLQRHVERASERMDSLLRWLAIDGYGFHEGYFRWRRYLGRRANPARLSGYGRRVFDQGFGRSLWFVEGAEVDRVNTTIAAFPPTRHADLWSGVGLASAYVGGIDRAALETLRAMAEPHASHLVQGAAFAAKARQRAANPAPQTELACAVLCGMSADVVAAITDIALESLPSDNAEPAYEVWRQRIRERLGQEAAII
jgi:enediyne biosynthesis protein E3